MSPLGVIELHKHP